MGKISDNEIENDISLHEMNGNVYGILRNKMPLICPHIPHVLIKKEGSVLSGGQPSLYPQRSSCNSTCPMFHMEQSKDKESITVTIGCSHHTYYKIEEILTIKEQTKTEEITMKSV